MPRNLKNSWVFVQIFCQSMSPDQQRAPFVVCTCRKEPYAQAKLVRVISGEVMDVVVDCRLGSPSFGKLM